VEEHYTRNFGTNFTMEGGDSKKFFIDFFYVLSSFQANDATNIYLSASLFFRLCCSTFLLLVILTGLKYRLIIIKYLLSPTTKANAVNRLIWIEQIVGMLIPVNAIFWIVALLSPQPIGKVFGKSICIVFNALGNFRVAGSTIWSCAIAIYRMLCIRAQGLMNRKSRERMVFACLTSFGLISHLLFTIFLIKSDNSVAKRLCFNTTAFDQQSILAYQVDF